MIARYWGKKMREIWEGGLMKFRFWLAVEIAVLMAREKIGQIPAGTTERVQQTTWIDEKVVECIERRDREIGHDLNAFIEVMRCQIILGKDDFPTLMASDKFHEDVDEALKRATNCPDAGWFHDGMTSYDTEEPAMALLFTSSCAVIDEQLKSLIGALTQQALAYKYLPMMGRTHGQHAQPITFGIKILNWIDMLKRARSSFNVVANNARAMKLSGAVGMFGTLGPEVEDLVAETLNLTPVIATQIVAIDYRARVISELAMISSVIEKIAEDLWLMSQTEVGEIREPFGKRQKGSSAMPHKKNPIGIENIRGFAVVVRGYAHAMAELIATSHERDISHSGAERIIVPDAFGIVDHQLRRVCGIVKDMTVFRDRMRENIDLSCGTYASQGVEMLLKKYGLPAEVAYRKVQSACFTAATDRKHLKDVLCHDPELADIIGKAGPELDECFSPTTWLRAVDYIFERARLA